MNIHRFFIQSSFIDETNQIITCHDSKLVKQIYKVLRLENGDKIDILDGRGNIYHCCLQNLSLQRNREELKAIIEKKEIIPNSSKSKIIIALPLIRNTRFEWALEKLTELEVSSIFPVILDRNQIKSNLDNNNSEGKAKFIRWQRIIQEAAEQCERSMLPELNPPILFEEWLNKIDHEAKPQLRIICAERKNVEPVEKLLYNQKIVPATCAIAFGAEGGLTEEEIKLSQAHRFIPVSLGPLILRTETATLYTLAIVNAFLRLIQKDPHL